MNKVLVWLLLLGDCVHCMILMLDEFLCFYLEWFKDVSCFGLISFRVLVRFFNFR